MKLWRCAGVLLVQLLSGCLASPPPHGDGGAPAALATCTPPEGYQQPPCPGTLCAENALGAPDGRTADLTICLALDLVFTDGTIIAPEIGTDCQTAKPTFEVTLGRLAGATRVEASLEGKDFMLVGYIVENGASLPFTLVSPWCLAKFNGLTALLTLGCCTRLSQARFLRFSPIEEVLGRATIDAVTPLSFCRANERCRL